LKSTDSASETGAFPSTQERAESLEKIHLNLRQIVNFGIAAIVIDLIYFGCGIIPSMEFSGQLFEPWSWSVAYFIAPPDAKMTIREIILITLTVAAICIYGWANSLIEENV
jgi:hypothetical protein